MINKISRDVCLIKYRKFPLRTFDAETDDEVFYYPKIYYHYWLKLSDKNNLFTTT